MAPFCIKQWKTASTFHNYYFVGAAGAASPGFSPEKPYSYVKDEIFFDDKTSAVARNIATNICADCGFADVYMWVESLIDDRMFFANNLAKQMMHGRKTIAGDEIVDMVSRIIDYDVEFPEKIQYERIGHGDLYEILHDSSMTSYLQRVYFEQAIDGFTYIFNVNPLRTDVQDLTDLPKIFSSKANDILSDYLPVNNVINLMTRDDFSRHIRSNELVNLYFPPELASVYVVDTGDDALYSSIVAAATRTDSFYKKMFVSIYPIGPQIGVHLQTVFRNFALDSVCPFAKYRAVHGQVVYKIDLQAVRGVDPRMASSWTKEFAKVSKERESIMFKVVYGDFFVSLVLFSNLVYNLKLTFKKAQVDDIAYVDEYVLPFVNHVLGKIKDMAFIDTTTYDLEIPLLTKEMINKHNILEVNTVTYLTFVAKLPGLAGMNDRLATLGGVFYRTENAFGDDKRNVLTYKYTRCSGYSPDADISAYVRAQTATNRARTRREIADAIVQIYHVTREKAEAVYDDITNRHEDNNAHVARSYEGFVVKLVRASDYEVVCHVKGAKLDLEVANHIAGIVNALLLTHSVQRAPAAMAAAVPGAPGAQATSAPDGGFDPNAILDDDVAGESVSRQYELENSDDDDDSPPVAQAPGDELQSPLQRQQPQQPSPGGDAVNSKKYLLRQLKRADADLFVFKEQARNNRVYKSFASLCASNAKRQPIVVTDEQLAQNNKKYPGAVPNFAKVGSTPEKAAQNVYICPKIWCTHSEVAMTPRQFASKGCPSPDDKVLRLYQDGQEDRPKFVSFLDPSRHPKELCMPCCFFVDHETKMTGLLKKRFAKCSGARGATDQAQDDDTYIKGLVFPLEAGRYGRLPHTFATYMGSAECHAKGEDCFVRKGIHHESQYFLSCMAAVMDIDGVVNVGDLVEHIAANLTPRDFLTLNGGDTLRVFATDPPDIHEYYQDFRAWLDANAEYVAAYNIQAVRRAAHMQETTPEVRREFMVYVAMHNFYNYLRSDAQKTHEQLMGLFAVGSRFNPRGRTVLIVQDDGVDRLSVVCPPGDSANAANANAANANAANANAAKCVVVLNYEQFYEPVCEVRQVAGSLEERMEFDVARGAADPRIKSLHGFYTSSCRALGQPRDKRDNAAVSAAVIDAGFRCVGEIRDGVYIPRRGPCADVHNFVHVEHVDRYVTPTAVPRALKMLHEADRDAFYTGAIAHPNGIGVIMGDGDTYVPVGAGDHRDAMRTYAFDLDIFTDTELANRSHDYIEQWNMRNAALQGFKRSAVIAMLTDPDLRKSFDFIRFEHNPFPRDARADHMRRLLRRAAPGPSVLSTEEADRFVDALLYQDLTVLTSVDYKERPGVVFMSQAQIDAGELDALLLGT